MSVSSMINADPQQRPMLKKRLSMGGPVQSTAYQVNNNLLIGQIIAGPLQIKNKRLSNASIKDVIKSKST